MIGFMSLRDQGRGFDYPVSNQRTVADALSMLVCDLRFGARIEILSSTEIQTLTSFFGNTDQNTYTGIEEEMIPLVRVAALYAELVQGGASNSPRNVLAAHATASTFERLPQSMHGNTLVVTQMAVMNVGGGAARAALIASLVTMDESEIRALARVDLEDLVVVVALCHETGLAAMDVARELELVS